MKQPCPCGLPSDYAACCGRYHAGAHHLAAPNAEALMRSRYSAYVMKLEAYLLATWHPSTRPASLDLAYDASKWLGLEIKRSAVHNFQKNGARAAPEKTDPADRVEFVARYKIGGRAHRLHETSRFVQIDGRWFYLDGDLHNP